MSTKNSTHAVDALQDVRSAVAAIASVGQYNDQDVILRKSVLAMLDRHIAAPAVDAMWPQPGDLVRYGEGVTALALLGSPHARGWHSEQCMGGHLYHTDAHHPTDTDRRMWASCAVEWRGKTMAEARREAGLPPCLLYTSPSPRDS